MKLPTSIAIAFALVALPAFASEPGNLMNMKITLHMQIPGTQGMAPMTHTQKVCTSKTRPDPRQMMSRDKTCKVSNYRRIGNTVSYHLICSGDMPMSGDGKFTLLADDGIHGSAHMAGGPGGHAMQMDMTVDGSHVGSCDYTPPPQH